MGIEVFKGKPIEKLIETISQAIGTIYKPRAIRNVAKAEAFKIEILEEAKAKAASNALLIKNETENELVQRTKQRLAHQEITRQTNIDSIVEKAKLHLTLEVSDTPVDIEWSRRFFSIAQDISTEDLQEIWAKLLANEISAPGVMSLRTLNILSNLSSSEAKLFQKFSGFVTNSKVIVLPRDNANDLAPFGINYGDLLQLREAGLIQNIVPGEITREFLFCEEHMGYHFNFGDRCFILTLSPKATERIIGKKKALIMPIISFTSAGEQLLSITSPEPAYKFLEKLIDTKTKRGWKFCECKG